MRSIFVGLSVVVAILGATDIASAQYPYRREYGGPGYGPGYGGPGYGGGGQLCAYENQFCQFRGVADVRYGARGRYVVRRARNGIPCSNDVFGDPAPGIPKHCIID